MAKKVVKKIKIKGSAAQVARTVKKSRPKRPDTFKGQAKKLDEFNSFWQEELARTSQLY